MVQQEGYISADTTQAILTHHVLFEFVITGTQHRHLYIFLQVQFLRRRMLTLKANPEAEWVGLVLNPWHAI
jgi:hypothetical protein